MTCIAGYQKDGEVWLGGDSAGVAGLHVNLRKDTKVFKRKGIIFGFTSSFRMGQLIRYALKIPKHPSNMTDIRYLQTKFLPQLMSCLTENKYTEVKNNTAIGGTFLMAYHGKLYCVYGDFQIAEPLGDFLAVGCGEPYAFGSYWTNRRHGRQGRDIVKDALEAAAHYSGGVRPPFHILYSSGA